MNAAHYSKRKEVSDKGKYLLYPRSADKKIMQEKLTNVMKVKECDARKAS